MNDESRDRLIALAVGCLVGLLVFLTTGNRLVLVNDEGIYLEGAVRVLRGEAPYRDFFAICGPGTFWLLALVFRMAGITLRSARLLLALDLAVIAALIYWLTRRLSTRLAALCAALVFGALVMSAPNNVLVNHRWDSSTLALLAIATCLSVMYRPRRLHALAAGIMVMLAAWVTPSVGLLAIALTVWTGWNPRFRPTLKHYIAGLLAGGTVPAAALAYQNALVPMIQGMFWVAGHYAAANRQITYGSTFDSPAGLFVGVSGIRWVATAWLLAPVLLPAILPPAVALAWGPALRKPQRPEILLLVSGAALVASTYPRWDLLHLLYISPVFLVLAAVWLQQRSPVVGISSLFLIAVPAAVLCGHHVGGGWQAVALQTPSGRIAATPADALPVEMCLARVRPDHTLFVFPYEPIFYFLTQAHNPTYYSFLQPGMMGAEDEQKVLAGLSARPPDWVLYRDVPAEAYLRIWPSSDPTRLRLNGIEEFIRARYILRDRTRTADGEHQLLERRPE